MTSKMKSSSRVLIGLLVLVWGMTELAVQAQNLPDIVITRGDVVEPGNLYPTIPWVRPFPPLANQAATVSIFVENQGSAPVNEAFRIRLYVDGALLRIWQFSPVAEQKPAPLAPGGTRMYGHGIPPQAAGVHVIRVVADEDGVIGESSENNNVLEESVSWVEAEQMPDLVVEDIRPCSQPPMQSCAPGIPLFFGTEHIWAVSIKNKGETATLAQSIVRVENASSNAYDTLVVSPLAPGATQILKWKEPAYTGPLPIWITAIVDLSNTVVEADETNNKMVKGFNAAPAPLPPPNVTHVDPHYPGFPTSVYGTGFEPTSAAYFYDAQGSMLGILPVEYIDLQKVRVSLPTGFQAGKYQLALSATKQSLPGTPAPVELLEPKPMNLYWRELDANGFPLNPLWGTQLVNSKGSPLYNPVPGCVDSWGPLTTQFPYDEAHKDSAYLCSTVFKGEGRCSNGHRNSMGVTMEATVYWSAHSSDDDDYCLFIYRYDDAGSTHPDGHIEIEFHSEETIDNFDTPWWNNFHSAVDTSDAAAHQMIDGHLAIITGLFGLDCAHECDSELHPVWALAVNVKGDPTDDTWAMFVRNWGNEGFCSTEQWGVIFPAGEYTFRIPWRPGASSVQVSSAIFKKNRDDITIDVQAYPNYFVLVTFKLPPPFDKPFPGQWPLVHGEVHLNWTGGAIAPYPPLSLWSRAAALMAGPKGEGNEREEQMITRGMIEASRGDREAFSRELRGVRSELRRARRAQRPRRDQLIAIEFAGRRLTPATTPPQVATELPKVLSVTDPEKRAEVRGVIDVLARGGAITAGQKGDALRELNAAPDISGRWTSNMGIFYEITQEGASFSWYAEKLHEKGNGNVDGQEITASWSGDQGRGSATGRITAVDPRGRATRIEWKNGVIFSR